MRGRGRGGQVYLGTVPHTSEEEAASACSNLEDIAHEWPTTIHQARHAAHHYRNLPFCEFFFGENLTGVLNLDKERVSCLIYLKKLASKPLKLKGDFS